MNKIEVLNKSMEAKDPYTCEHALRVQFYAVKLAKAMNLSEKKLQKISIAAMLHDIGKLAIDDCILKKPGKLTVEEYNEIKKHPQIGADIIRDVNDLKGIDKIIQYHHERYDGTGYPEGLMGSNIPQEAAILAIADVYDAMTSDRPYRKALTSKQAMSEIIKNTGTQFNPKIVKKFISVMQ